MLLCCVCNGYLGDAKRLQKIMVFSEKISCQDKIICEMAIMVSKISVCTVKKY
jgi:hypothetical protein